MRLAAGGRGLIAGAAGLVGMQGAGQLGGSLLFKSLLVSQKALGALGNVGLGGTALGVGFMTQELLASGADRFLGTDEGTPLEFRPIERSIRLAGFMGRAARNLPPVVGYRVPEFYQEFLTSRAQRGLQGMTVGYAAQLGLNIPTQEETAARLQLERGARGAGFGRGLLLGKSQVATENLQSRIGQF